MTQPWFDPMYWSWLPGTALGVTLGAWGAAVGCLAPHGRAKTLMYAVTAVLLLVSIALLAAGLYALASDQPYGVWYGLTLPGVIGVVLVGSLSFVMRQRYRQAEQRLMQAKDL